RFKARVRELTYRTRGVSLTKLIEPLARYLIGWRGYFGFCPTPRGFANLDAWVCWRVRMYLWGPWWAGGEPPWRVAPPGVGVVRWRGCGGGGRGGWFGQWPVAHVGPSGGSTGAA